MTAVLEPRMHGVLRLFEPFFNIARRKSWPKQVERMRELLEAERD